MTADNARSWSGLLGIIVLILLLVEIGSRAFDKPHLTANQDKVIGYTAIGLVVVMFILSFKK